MTLDEAIKHCLEQARKLQDKADRVGDDESRQCMECAADHIQLAEWLTDYEELKKSIGAVKFSNMKEALELIREYKAENIAQKKLIAEYKRLLKAAVEDLSCGGENNKCTKSCKTCTYNSIKGYGCRYFGEYHWRYAAEALALIGGETDEQI